MKPTPRSRFTGWSRYDFPVDSESFLGSIWETRASSDPLNPAPQVLVWGTGSDANATIER